VALPKRLVAGGAALLCLFGLSACGSATTVAPDAASLLAAARRVVDATPAVHFVLSSSDVATSGLELLGGSGNLVRPDDLEGSFQVSEDGIDVALAVVSVRGAFFVELPFARHYRRANPASYGFSDPAALIDPTTGVSALLADAAPHARDAGQVRLDGELLDVVTGSVAGDEVPVLPDADRSRPVTLRATIDPTDDQLRTVTLSGPFTSASTTTTYTVTLSDYGERVKVHVPPTGS
jgi:hypothetical protein